MDEISINKAINIAVDEFKNLQTKSEIDEWRIKYLGRKGYIANLFKQMRSLSKDDKPKMGKVLNEARKRLESCVSTENKSKVVSTNRNSYSPIEYKDVGKHKHCFCISQYFTGMIKSINRCCYCNMTDIMTSMISTKNYHEI